MTYRIGLHETEMEVERSDQSLMIICIVIFEIYIDKNISEILEGSVR